MQQYVFYICIAIMKPPTDLNDSLFISQACFRVQMFINICSKQVLNSQTHYVLL